ncbi:MAG: rRNA maturation RNase YbeY [Planctomycetota bacterium]|jgi:probable rRNA maturation factor
MASEHSDIVVWITCEYEGLDADFNRLEELVRFVCRRFKLEKAMINIAIVGDEKITEVNTKFLKTPHSTDVISFDLSDDPSCAKSYDLLINAALAQAQAQKRGHSTEAELALYITHGLLHNLGFDDADEAGSRKMHNTEDEILQQTGFGIIYGE